MGIWDILKKKIANEDNNHHTGLEDTVIGKDVYEIAAFDVKNSSLEEKIAYYLSSRSQGEQIQLADQLLREGPYNVCINLYKALIQKYPEERDRYENGIGNAYLKMGEFDKAIEFYILSRSHGMHSDISEKNIWDACLKMYKESKDLKYIREYIHHSNGKYLEKAEAILQNPAALEVVNVPKKEVVSEENETEEESEEAVTVVGNDSNIEQEAKNLKQEEQVTEEDMTGKKKQVDINQISLFGFRDETISEKKEEVVEQVREPIQTGEPDIETIGEKPLEKISYIDESESFDISKSDEIEENTKLPFEEVPNMLTALDYHIDRFFSNEDIIVWEDKRSDDLKIDIFHIKPNENRNFNVLLTYGMSRKPMNVPLGNERFKYGELAMLLPRDWDLSPAGLKDINNYWPILLLKNIARIPVSQNSWLCYGHSIPNGEPSKPIADTHFEGVVLMDSASLPEAFQELTIGNENLFIYTVIPIYPEEIEFKLKKGIDALRDAFIDMQLKDVVWIDRPSAISETEQERDCE
ncbi:MAG: suppressor of fused domain protein [Chitinophagales bacterium]|nr:suppressor of fused domain protein [Chitinophagales bacterium]